MKTGIGGTGYGKAAGRSSHRGPGATTTEDDAESRQTSSAGQFDTLQPVADAVLYEGYVLYPYRQSSTKNSRARWQFGVLLPSNAVPGPDDASVAGSVESWFQQTECLLEPAPGARVAVRIRFLQVQRKTVERKGASGDFVTVPRLTAAGRLHVTFDEAIPREWDVTVDLDDVMAGERDCPFEFAGDEIVEEIEDDGAVGLVRRRSWPVSAILRVSACRADAPFPLLRLRLRLENTCADLPMTATRDDALTRALVSAHTFVGIDGGAFVSLLDPPEWAARAAKKCANIHTFPVLGGEESTTDLVLSSPIILYDHPKVAPESPGNLFDATEIDEILSLRTLTLSDDEKQEARATDPRAAEVIDRVDTMPPEMLAKLHGAVRSLRPVQKDASTAAAEAPQKAEKSPPWWDPGADASLDPGADRVSVDGGEVSKGSLVRLRPRLGGTDPHDMFLAGRTARVEAVFLDVDDAWHVAVTLVDDPGADLHQWYGRYRYFFPDEVELLASATEPS